MSEEVPRAVRVAAAWSWRLLVIAGAVLAVALLLWKLKLPMLALFVAILLSALLAPAVRLVEALVGSRAWATLIVLVVGLTALVLVGWLLVAQISGSLTDVGSQFSTGIDQIRSWLNTSFGINDTRLQSYVDGATKALRANRDSLVSGAVSGAGVALEVVTGVLLTFFATIFLVADGGRIWSWFVSLFPRHSQEGVRHSGGLAWTVLTGYVRGTVIIAFVDALCIGLALALLRVPLALPLALLVFFGAFVPIVGAFTTGAIAVVVALATRGPVVALLVLAAILLVQQLEGHVLQPLVMGRLVSVHPLGVVLTVTAGGVLAGLIGAVVAVPVVAVATTVIGYYGRRARGTLDPPAEVAEVEEESGSLADPVVPVR